MAEIFFASQCPIELIYDIFVTTIDKDFSAILDFINFLRVSKKINSRFLSICPLLKKRYLDWNIFSKWTISSVQISSFVIKNPMPQSNSLVYTLNSENNFLESNIKQDSKRQKQCFSTKKHSHVSDYGTIYHPDSKYVIYFEDKTSYTSQTVLYIYAINSDILNPLSLLHEITISGFSSNHPPHSRYCINPDILLIGYQNELIFVNIKTGTYFIQEIIHDSEYTNSNPRLVFPSNDSLQTSYPIWIILSELSLEFYCFPVSIFVDRKVPFLEQDLQKYKHMKTHFSSEILQTPIIQTNSLFFVNKIISKNNLIVEIEQFDFESLKFTNFPPIKIIAPDCNTVQNQFGKLFIHHGNYHNGSLIMNTTNITMNNMIGPFGNDTVKVCSFPYDSICLTTYFKNKKYFIKSNGKFSSLSSNMEIKIDQDLSKLNPQILNQIFFLCLEKINYKTTQMCFWLTYLIFNRF